MMKNLITDDEADQVKQALTSLFDKLGRNEFEGEFTQRIYSTMAKTRAVDWLATHPRILALLDRMFMPNYLLSQLLGINILPGESAQFIHPDDGFYPVPRPRPPLGAASIFALDDFTEENGATRLIPKSHLWGQRKPTKDDKVISAVMPKGSAIFYGGTFWHGGGANVSDGPRMALTAQYCEPWLRQQENLMMAIPKDIVQKLDPQLQSLLGYSILPPYGRNNASPQQPPEARAIRKSALEVLQNRPVSGSDRDFKPVFWVKPTLNRSGGFLWPLVPVWGFW